MILAVVRAGWLNLRRDRAALMLSFIVPIVFFSIFAGIFGAQRSRTPRVTLAVADEDRSPRSKQFVAGLKKESALKIVEAPKDGAAFDARTAEEFVRAGDAPVALVIPKGFGATQVQFGPSAANVPAVVLLADSADPIADQVVNGLLQKTMMTAMPATMMTAGVDSVDRWSGGLTPEQRATLDQNITVFESSRSTQTTGDDTLLKVTTKDVLGENKSNAVAALYAAGIGVMFLLFTASNAGGVLLEENESGTLDRILTTRVSFTTLMAGKLVYLWSLGTLQLTIMFVWGAVAFKLALAEHVLGFAIMAIVTSLTCAAFGLFLASLCRTRAQLSAISTLVVLTFSALGGSMFPRFLMPEALQKAGLVLFNAWALEGFTNVFWREEPLSSLAVPCLVLLAWAAAFFLTARRLAARWEVS